MVLGYQMLDQGCEATRARQHKLTSALSEGFIGRCQHRAGA